MNGWQRVFQPEMKARILIIKSRTDGKLPRSGGRGEVELHAWIGGQPGLDLGSRVGGVVVHDQVQLAVGVGPGDVLAEGQELLVRCRALHSPVTFPVAISNAANKVVVPCRT